ncbi:MAG TPA: hypothetical protein VFE10_15910 [Phenylobacterium sp.]|jgi:hypothetical protein|nr:hypothetical protein [Phenylobacterium sp.]
MTVAELIAALSKLPPTLQVVMPSEDLDFCLVGRASADVGWVDGDYVQLAFESDLQSVPVVRLMGSGLDLFPPKDGQLPDD